MKVSIPNIIENSIYESRTKRRATIPSINEGKVSIPNSIERKVSIANSIERKLSTQSSIGSNIATTSRGSLIQCYVVFAIISYAFERINIVVKPPVKVHRFKDTNKFMIT